LGERVELDEGAALGEADEGVQDAEVGVHELTIRSVLNI
jgi:hypothetical protein